MSGKTGSELPASATRQYHAYVGVGSMGCVILLLRIFSARFEPAWLYASFILLAYSVPVMFLEFFVGRACFYADNLSFSAASPSIKRTAIKLVGLYASLGLVAALYWLFPEYHGAFYDHYFKAFRFFVPLLIVIAPLYIYHVDKHMVKPLDGYWHLGTIFFMHGNRADFEKIRQHLLGWFVKGFFLPLMFTYLCQDLNRVIGATLIETWSFHEVLSVAIDLLYFIDVAIAVAGYVFSMRLIDTHIRSCEPTTTGWVVALVCYQPFYSMVGDQYLAYSEGRSWSFWLAAFPVVGWIWGAVTLVLVFIYAWATVVFGLRFSNLTNRGIITSGPYRWTKHPAYLAKNISWWMISMPFMSQFGVLEALRHCLLLGLLNLCYFLRAKTEERHLEADPVYREYSDWINKHGLFSNIVSLVRFCSATIRARSERQS
jgi:protein-S-isoprenylcysteine O-methyltransferase Ste14